MGWRRFPQASSTKSSSSSGTCRKSTSSTTSERLHSGEWFVKTERLRCYSIMRKDLQPNLAELSDSVEIWLEPVSCVYLNFFFYFETWNVVFFIAFTL